MRLLSASIIFSLSLIGIISCEKNESGESIEEIKLEILELHQAQRDFHFNKDSVAFANLLSDNFISVNRGEISNPSREETISRYYHYFSSVEFLKWDDVSDPIIRFSDDGSMAYTIVDKVVTVNYVDEKGDSVTGETHFAWTTIYKKYGNDWKIDCVSSTYKP